MGSFMTTLEEIEVSQISDHASYADFLHGQNQMVTQFHNWLFSFNKQDLKDCGCFFLLELIFGQRFFYGR